MRAAAIMSSRVASGSRRLLPVAERSAKLITNDVYYIMVPLHMEKVNSRTVGDLGFLDKIAFEISLHQSVTVCPQHTVHG